MIRKWSKLASVFVLIFLWLFTGSPRIWTTPQVLAAANTETFTTAGTSTWTAPAGVTSVDVEAWGGGGAGGPRSSNGCGGGGGGGAYAKSTISVTPGTGYSYTVGSAGASGGANGGNSSFNTNSVIAEGGKSVASNTTTGGSGGLSVNSTGTTKYNGGSGFTCTSTGGGGGGSGGTGSNGTSATSSSGAGAVPGGGPGGNGRTGTQGAGSPPASGPGGGGGGGYRTGSSTRAGGAGYAGKIALTYTIYTVLGNGTDPGNSSIGPDGAATEIDRFSFVDSTGTDTVTGLTVTLAPTGAYNNIASVDVQTTAGVSKCSNSSLTGDAVTLSACAISVTTSLTEYKVMITPKTHANMPAVPGASYDTTAIVTTWTGTNTQTGTDSGSATVTVDNLSPNGATLVSGSSGDGAITLNWTSSNSSDFLTTNGSVILRWAGGTAGGEVPQEGTTSYSAGNTIGTATVACVISSAASTALSKIDGTGGSTGCTISALTGGQAYTYKVFQADANGNYDAGVSIGTFTPAVISLTITSDGSVSYGILAGGIQKSTIASELNDTQTVKNDGNVPEDFTIKTSNATGGTQWNLGAAAGSDTFVHEFSVNGGGAWTKFTTADIYQSFVNNIGSNGTQNFDLRITAPSSSTDFQQKSITVTILASLH